MKKFQYQIAHFAELRIIHVKRDDNVVAETHNSFIQGVESVKKYFNLKIESPFFNIFIAPDRKEYDRFVAHLTKTPTSKGRVGQPQVLDLYLLSPNAYKEDASPFFAGTNGNYDNDIYKRVIVHETVHMMEEFLAPKGHMEHQALAWSSEGLAVYVSEQYLKEQDIRKCMQTDLDENNIPALKELKGAVAYIWGWTVPRFIEKKYGRNKILSYIKAPCRTDLLKLLDAETSEFEKEWKFQHQSEAEKLVGNRKRKVS